LPNFTLCQLQHKQSTLKDEGLQVVQDYEDDFTFYNWPMLNNLMGPPGGTRTRIPKVDGKRSPLPRQLLRTNGAPLKMFFPLNEEKYEDEVIENSRFMLRQFQDYHNNAVIHDHSNCEPDLCEKVDARLAKNAAAWKQHFGRKRKTLGTPVRPTKIARTATHKDQDNRAEAALSDLMTDSQLFGVRFGRLEQEVQKNQKLVIMLLKVLTGDDDDKESIKQEFKNFMMQEEHELVATQISEQSDMDMETGGAKDEGKGEGESKEKTA
jgi:hypothetical protein